MEHQFDQMKEEMVTKEAAVQRERSEKNDLENAREDLENKLEKASMNYYYYYYHNLTFSSEILP